MDYRIQMLNLNFRVMKISKYLLVAAASVMLFSCAKDDVQNGIVANGEPVALTVSIANSGVASKAGFTPSGNNILAYENEDVTITLHATSGNQTATLGENQTHTFYNVEGPQYVEVSIRNGKGVYAQADIEGLQSIAASEMPAYGKSENITEANYVGTIAGVVGTADEGKEYKEYAVDVYVKIPVARLEMGGIHHEAHEGETCLYGTLNFDNIVVRNAPVSATYSVNSEESAFIADEEVKDLIEETIEAEGTNGFFPGKQTFPAAVEEEVQCYAFNFCTGSPVIAFDFTDEKGEKQYAIVENFVGQEGPITSFEAGKIYQIKSIEITDDDLTPDYDGNKLVAVTVTVEVQDWAIVPMNDVVFK